MYFSARLQNLMGIFLFPDELRSMATVTKKCPKKRWFYLFGKPNHATKCRTIFLVRFAWRNATFTQAQQRQTAYVLVFFPPYAFRPGLLRPKRFFATPDPRPKRMLYG